LILCDVELTDERRGVVVGFWEEPGLCQGFLYFALRIDRVITEDEVFQRPISESSESGSESSESVASGVSVSESSGSEQLKGLDEYYCFLWDPQINDFPVILDRQIGGFSKPISRYIKRSNDEDTCWRAQRTS
jgi:hypothetical protein